MSIFSIGVSGLNAAQVALSTTSNNITNVYTDGYNRQTTLLGESGVGNGVQVEGVQRQFNQFVATQLNQATSNSSALDTYETQIAQIDNLLADSEAGLAPLLQSFFSSLQDLASAPSDPAARQGLIGTADTLSAQFRAFDGYLEDMQQGVNGQIEDVVFQINNTAEQIAMLNREISLAKAKTGEAPNSLLDQRDQLVAELSTMVDVELTIQDGGTYNISIGNGQSLVSGTRSFALEAMASSADPSRTVVGYRDGAGNLREFSESTFTGGELGGLMTFRSETLDKTQNQLGQLAVSLAQGFNAQHAEGVDLNGDAGGDFFSIGAPTVYSNANNDSAAYLEASFSDDLSGLTASDYDVKFSATDGYSVTRRDTGETTTFAADATTLEFGGMVVTVSGTPADGDRFLIQPTRHAAGQLENLIQDTALIAAGQAEGGTGSGDNRNALALQALQDEALVGGVASLSQAYASMVGDVGNRTNVVQVNRQAQAGLTQQLRALQLSESGVNLDEEAANLIRFQQYYQASAKVIEVGATVLDTLLGLDA
ncbi:flagellar hook-associated protein FlgK [Azotobacter chroococcum]|uniref:Flagellar hook-associated protein 1 n=1 Tax=Azotobacter chroococcum TaxID=353 RepID=A0A4R1PKC1_9GAMM|nr:flagellar hook-associated protein FlgK [Azotobacter chroococcum]TBV97534.1 flagellar hook-associated protein FlgK [Azotobacter chroococcum]TCL28078.1 flagellar hook-associated protein 1 FlgK [Azotobacter chroococcum]